MPELEFGGPWTFEKLNILSTYLNDYTKVMKNQSFRLTYVDAFAGSGSWSPRSVQDMDQPTDFREMWKGSAAIAIDIDDKPFDRLVFIEKDDDRCRFLRRLASHHRGRHIDVVNKDANEVIPAFCRSLDYYDRAVVFLDPFATEVSWRTVEAIANTKKIDCWILFPLGAIGRLMPLNRDPDPEMAHRLDRVFGGRQYWYGVYENAHQLDLFGQQNRERFGGSETIIDLYRNRLESVFERVAPTVKELRNSKNAPIFALFFAASNKAGASIAVKIADHILSKW